MHNVTVEQLSKLLKHHEEPCISLYQPTHRRFPDNQKDSIRYKNTLHALERTLGDKYSRHEKSALFQKFQSFEQNDGFWNSRSEGLAILGSPDTFEVFDLPWSVEELLVISDSFHVRPLIRALQFSQSFHILALSRHKIKLFKGSESSVEEINLAEEVPGTIEEALGSELTEPHITVASYSGKAARHGQHGSPAISHGHGQKKDEVDIDDERFFRIVDRSIAEKYSTPDGLPLILAALPEHQGMFRKISHNAQLLEEGISIDPWALSNEKLLSEAQRIIQPSQSERLKKLIDSYEEAVPKRLGSSNIKSIAKALTEGRVGTLLVEAERQMSGKLISDAGQIEQTKSRTANDEDLLDDLAEKAIKMGGEVLILSADQMPSETGVAAIYRY
jgi:hypothetical protein